MKYTYLPVSYRLTSTSTSITCIEKYYTSVHAFTAAIADLGVVEQQE